MLAILAPVASARLTDATDTAILQGASLVLDAQIDPLEQARARARRCSTTSTPTDPRASLSEAVEARRGDFADDAAVYNRLANRLDDVVVGAILDAFQIAYLIAAALALLAAALLVTAWRRPAIWLAAAAAAGCAVVFAVEQDAEAPPPVVARRPVQPARRSRAPAGIAGAIQQQALKQLDQAACRLGVPREELALAIFDADRAQKFEARARRRPAQHDLAAVTARRGLAPAARRRAAKARPVSTRERREVDRRLADRRPARPACRQPPARASAARARISGQRATEPAGVDDMVHRFNGGVAEVELFVFLLFAVVVLAGPRPALRRAVPGRARRRRAGHRARSRACRRRRSTPT